MTSLLRPRPAACSAHPVQQSFPTTPPTTGQVTAATIQRFTLNVCALSHTRDFGGHLVSKLAFQAGSRALEHPGWDVAQLVEHLPSGHRA